MGNHNSRRSPHPFPSPKAQCDSTALDGGNVGNGCAKVAFRVERQGRRDVRYQSGAPLESVGVSLRSQCSYDPQEGTSPGCSSLGPPQVNSQMSERLNRSLGLLAGRPARLKAGAWPRRPLQPSALARPRYLYYCPLQDRGKAHRRRNSGRRP